MENKKYYTVVTIPKPNGLNVEREVKSMTAHFHSVVEAFQLKCGRVKSVIWTWTSPISAMMRHVRIL